MLCPKCNIEMIKGEIGVDAFSRGVPALYWAQDEFFNTHVANFVTANKAVSEGGIKIKLGNGLTSNRTTAYACKECNCIVLLNA